MYTFTLVMGRTEQMASTCAFACSPLPMMPMTLASSLAMCFVASPATAPVRISLRTRLSITACSWLSDTEKTSTRFTPPPYVLKP